MNSTNAHECTYPQKYALKNITTNLADSSRISSSLLPCTYTEDGYEYRRNIYSQCSYTCALQVTVDSDIMISEQVSMEN